MRTSVLIISAVAGILSWMPATADQYRIKGVPPAPQPDDEIITNPLPDLPRETYMKNGYGWVWTDNDNIASMSSTGSVSMVVRDGDKIYLSNPMSLMEVEGWLEGTVEGDRITLKLPQYVQHRFEKTPVGQPNIYYDDYILALDYGEDEDGSWYFPCEEQTYVFIKPDGSFIPEDETVMLGHCIWINPEDYGDNESEPQWDWRGSGDIYKSLVPVRDTPVEVPAQTEFENYNIIYNQTYFPVQVGFNGNDCYIKGLCHVDEGLKDAAIKGTLADGKITFPTGQYFGIMPKYLNTAFFMAGKSVVEKNEDNQDVRHFKPGEKMVFDYDPENHILTSADDFCLSVTMDEPYYVDFIMNPTIRINDPDAKVEKLYTPIYWDLYPQTDYNGFVLPNQPLFILPIVSEDLIPLDTDRLFYQVFVNEDLFTFYHDEYPSIEDELTEIPFAYNDDDDFYGSGTLQYLYVKPLDVESLAVRSVYYNKDGSVVYSDKLYFIGEDPSGVENITDADKTVVDTEWYDFTGRRIQSPVAGISIRVDRLSDGTTKTTKSIYR